MLQHVVTDGVHQMRFAESHTTVDEQRVVGPRRRLRHGAAGGVRKLIRRSDDECVEGVSRVQPGGPWLRRRRASFQGNGLVCAERDHRGVRLDIGDEMNEEIRSLKLSCGFRDHPRVMLRQPILEQGVRHANRQRRPIVTDECGGPEPGIEAVAVYLGFNATENLVPEVHCAQLAVGENVRFLA